MTAAERAAPEVFEIKDCALISLATGQRVLTLQELRDRLAEIGADSVFAHFWGGLLQARFEERELGNDFAAWAQHRLHDPVLAERLAVIDPTAFPDTEDLRLAVLDVLEDRIDEEPYLARRLATREFHFIRSQVVVFPTERRLRRAEELAETLPKLSAGSVFFHFVEARRRHPEGRDDFSAWLLGFDGRYADLVGRLAAVDPYFGSLVELRRTLTSVVRSFFEGSSR